MVYVVLALLLLCIWLPIRKPTYRWEMLIYGTPIVYRHRIADPEERKWNWLREQWHRRDVT
jgi:hypothetical protein